MPILRGPARALYPFGVACLLLAGCEQVAEESGFARAALERNPRLEVIAYDSAAQTFTVKVKATGELRVIRAGDIVGTLPGMEDEGAGAGRVATAEAPLVVANASTDVPQPTQEAVPGESASSPQEREQERTASHETSTAGTARPGGTAVIRDAATGAVLASTGGEEARSGDSARPTGVEGQTSAGAQRSADSAGGDSRLLASGPGYSIRAGDAPAAPVRLASTSAQIPSPVAGVAVERRDEPLICQGARLLHIDGRNLRFEGDAVTAEDGCEIHITNSHIIAGGVGVTARAANVHIKNSVIEGESGSVSASEGAKVYTQSSTFRGLSRRLDTATFHDLGGTVWN